MGGLGGAVCVCEWVGKGDMYMASLRMSSWCARIDVLMCVCVQNVGEGIRISMCKEVDITRLQYYPH